MIPAPEAVAGPGRELARWPAILLAFWALVLLLTLLWPLGRLAGGAPWVPAWDEAKYGVAGLRLAAAFSDADLAALWREVNALSVWPPFFPLLESAAFLVAGPEPGVARQLVVLLFGATLALACVSLGKAGAWLGVVVAVGLFASPLNQTFAVLAMLEIPGLFLLCAAWACAVRALDAETAGEPPGRWWRATWLASAALFFCKYNYGVIWLAALIGYRLWHQFPSSARDGRPLLRSGWTWAAAAVATLALVLRSTGGTQFTIQGQTVSITSAGNAFYALVVLATLRGLWQLARRPSATWRTLRMADQASQGAVACLVAPIGLWLVIPPHAKDLVGFLENRSSDLSWWAGLSFYPEALMSSWAPSPWVAWVLLALALPALRHASQPGPIGLAVWAAGIHWLALILHGYKEDRFIVHGAFWVLVLAAFSIAEALARTLGKGRALAGAALGLVLVVAVARVGLDLHGVADRAAVRCAPAGTREAVTEIARVSQEGSAGDVLVLGTWNLLSPWWLEWQARLEGRKAPLAVYRLGDDTEAAKVLARLRRGSRPARVVIIETSAPGEIPPPFSGQVFSAEHAWLGPIRTFLRDGGGYRHAETVDLPASGYRLVVYAAS